MLFDVFKNVSISCNSSVCIQQEGSCLTSSALFHFKRFTDISSNYKNYLNVGTIVTKIDLELRKPLIPLFLYRP